MPQKLKKSKTGEVGPKPGVQYVIIPPDGGYGWVIAFAGFFAMFVGEGTMFSFGLFIDEIKDDMGTTLTLMSVAYAAMAGFYFIFGPLMCGLVNRFGFRSVGVTGGIIASCGFMCSSFTVEPYSFIVVFGLLSGTGFSMMYFSTVLAVAVYFDRWRGVAISIALCGGTAGSMAIPQFILKVMKGLDWRMQFKCFAGMSICCGLVTLLYKPLQPFEIYSKDSKPMKIDSDSSITDFLNKIAQETPSFTSIKNRSIKTNYSDRQSVRIRVSSKTSTKRGRSCRICCVRFWKCHCDCECCENGECQMGCKQLFCCGPHCCTQQCCVNQGRPMMRKDILYNASVNTLPDHKNVRSSATSVVDYQMSVTRITPIEEAQQEEKCCICCPHSVKSTLKQMMDVSVMKIPSFNLMALSAFLMTMSSYCPPMYMTQKAREDGVKEPICQVLLTTFGAASLFGRVLCVGITSFPKIDYLLLTIILSFIFGASVILANVSKHMINHLTYATVFGITMAIIFSVKTPMVVQLYGLDKLSSSFGVCMMGYGLAGFLGVPGATYILDLTHSYEIVFYIVGVVGVMSGVVLIPIICMLPKERVKELAKEHKLLIGEPDPPAKQKKKSSLKEAPTTSKNEQKTSNRKPEKPKQEKAKQEKPKQEKPKQEKPKQEKPKQEKQKQEKQNQENT